jgi:hypothetical protein
MAGDEIVDAEWEEIPESNLAAQPPRLTTSHSQQADNSHHTSAAQVEASPWRSYAFWHDVVGRILVVVGRIGLAALGIIVLLLVIVWLDPGDTHAPAAKQPASGAQTQAERQPNAKQMLSEWSEAVMGKPSTIGFALIDGKGKSGEFCSSSSGTSLMNFGGRSLPPEHADMYTYNAFAKPLPNLSASGRSYIRSPGC